LLFISLSSSPLHYSTAIVLREFSGSRCADSPHLMPSACQRPQCCPVYVSCPSRRRKAGAQRSASSGPRPIVTLGAGHTMHRTRNYTGLRGRIGRPMFRQTSASGVVVIAASWSEQPLQPLLSCPIKPVAGYYSVESSDEIGKISAVELLALVRSFARLSVARFVVVVCRTLRPISDRRPPPSAHPRVSSD